MSALDASIDGLYQLPLNEFTGARKALAKTLGRDEAARVRALAKPTLVPWAVNQVYWRARGTFDRLVQSGRALRAAQVAALEGRAADLPGARDGHRRAVADAVADARRLAALAGARPNTDALARTFESLSLASAASEPPGRLTAEVHPAGFEAVAGIALQADRSHGSAPPKVIEDARAKRAAEDAARRIAAERKEREAAVKQAEADLTGAEASERGAREVWERAHNVLLEARRRLATLKSEVASLKSEV